MATKKLAAKEPVQFAMPKEVSDWIEQANSRIKYLTQKSERLAEEVRDLKKINKIMEARVMGTSRGSE